jgi:hypothetical protein
VADGVLAATTAAFVRGLPQARRILREMQHELIGSREEVEADQQDADAAQRDGAQRARRIAVVRSGSGADTSGVVG